ncbi:MAG: ABC transporter permease [Bacilli bacterium]|nr:ABC transporter permease [Bacilli bacterium]
MEKKKILMPLLGMVGGLLLVLLLTFPILSMEIKDIKVGVISLDEGITSPKGNINAGDEFVKNILKTDNKAIKLQKVTNEKEIKQNLKDGKYYMTITVPKDFTKNSLNQDGKINAVINEGLNPMVTMQLSQIVTALGTKAGITFDIKSINSISYLGIKAMLLPMMLIMMTFITS